MFLVAIAIYYKDVITMYMINTTKYFMYIAKTETSPLSTRIPFYG